MEDKEKQKQTKLEAGAWDKITNESNAKIDFEINKAVNVLFVNDEPEEIQGKDGVFYKFNVKIGNEDKYFMTGAFSLLGPLSKLRPLTNKKVAITKKIENGKQGYSIIPLD